MGRTRVRKRRLLGLAVVVATGSVLSAHVAGATGGRTEPRQGSARVYVVRPGDTLWSIARTIGPASDPRAVVASIQETNGLDSATIRPGQSLSL